MSTLPVIPPRGRSHRVVTLLGVVSFLIAATHLGLVSPSAAQLQVPPRIDQARDSWFGWTNDHKSYYRLVLGEGSKGELAVHRHDDSPTIFHVRWSLRNSSLILEPYFPPQGWSQNNPHSLELWAKFDGERIHLTHYEMSGYHWSYALRGTLGIWLFREGTLLEELELLQSTMYPRDTSTEAQRLRDLLHARYGTHWLVKWDPRKGTYEKVSGLIPHLAGVTCGENATAYKEILSLMKVDMRQFSLQPIYDSGGGGDCRAKQAYEGVPVEGLEGGGVIRIDRIQDRRPGKDLIIIDATIYDVHIHSTTPLVLEIDAVEIARKEMLAKDLVPRNARRTLIDYHKVGVLSNLLLFPIEDAECIDSCVIDFRLVWRIEFNASFDLTDPKSQVGFSIEGFIYYVDAHSGVIVWSSNGQMPIPRPIID